MIYSLFQIKQFPLAGLEDGSWHLAKYLGVTIMERIKAAIFVFMNKGCVVKWF